MAEPALSARRRQPRADPKGRTAAIDKPNILFVFPDQLSARWLGCYGNETVQAPCLDRLAARSVRFDRAYTNCPLCTPYRGCLLTGRYPSQTGIVENGMRLPEGCRTLAHHLADAGYDTNYVGKWHLSGDPQRNRWVPPEQRGGFEHFIGWESHHVDHYAGLIWQDDPDSPMELPGHETDGLTEIVVGELGRLAGGDRPFYLTVSYQAPHAPCTPPEQYGALYDASVLNGPPSTDPDAWFRNRGWNADYGIEEFRRRYFGEISHLDAAFGRVLDALDDGGLADSTIVIFTSDHGDMAGCHGLFGKGVMHDEAVRVPLLVRMPQARESRTVARPVATVDLFSTILDLAGAPIPESAEGRSFRSDLAPGAAHADDERDVFIEYKQDCIIRGDLKLITDRDGDEPTHCFDLRRDPYELDNLAGRLDPRLQADLLSSLAQWRQRTRAS